MVVNNLYYGNDNNATLASTQKAFAISDEVIERALHNIYRRHFNPKADIEPSFFHAFVSTINNAAEKGISQAPTPDDDFLRALRHNNAVFAAFKTHRLQNDVARRLLDSNGNLKPFEQWKNDVQGITSHQCNAWLRTEYDTAVLRARQAANWQQFRREKDVLPNLEWMPSTSPNPGADHMPFWGTILPVDHPFWSLHRPGDRWNCKCDLRATEKPATAVPHDGNDDHGPHPGLDNNPGADAQLFANSHPYIANAYPGAAKAVEKAIGEYGQWSFETEKEYPNGGKVQVHQLVNPADSDYQKLIQIADFFARHGHEARLTPKMSRPQKFVYQNIYHSLMGTKYEGKCPDLLVDDKWYEHEGFISTNPKRAFRNMLNDGLKQSDRLIIERPDLTEAYMKRVIHQRVKEGQAIAEIWIKDGRKLQLLYKKSEE